MESKNTIPKLGIERIGMTNISDNMVYGRIETSPEVYSAIFTKHRKDLVTFATYSAPDGDQFGDHKQGLMFTSWGIKGSDFPLIEAQTTWDIDSVPEIYKRNNEKHQYWICLPKENIATSRTL